MSLRRVTVLATALAAAAGPGSALAANPGTANTTTKQPMTIRIDSPANGASVPLGDLTVSGVTSIGPLTGGPTGTPSILYAVDKSGSTSSSGGDCNGDGTVNAGDDYNGDGNNGDTLDCEIAGVIALNASIAGAATNGAGVIAFGDAADQGDVSPAGGQQDFAAPGADASGNGRPDVEDVARSITRSGIAQFTAKSASGSGTSFDAPLSAANTAVAAHGGGRSIVFLLSDGGASINTAAGGPLDQARAAGTQVFTFSIGSGGSGCGSSSSLATIASTTGGACTVVSDPSKLTGALAGAGGAVTGTSVKAVAVGANALTPALATLSGQSFSGVIPAARLHLGANTIAATAQAADGTLASADVVVNAFRLTGASALPLPSAKRCTSRRAFPIRVRRYSGIRYDFARVAVNGRAVPVYVYTVRRVRVTKIGARYLNAKRFRAFVDLRGLVRGTYKVRVTAVTTDGRILSNTRKYRTCTRKLAGSIPKR